MKDCHGKCNLWLSTFALPLRAVMLYFPQSFLPLISVFFTSLFFFVRETRFCTHFRWKLWNGKKGNYNLYLKIKTLFQITFGPQFVRSILLRSFTSWITFLLQWKSHDSFLIWFHLYCRNKLHFINLIFFFASFPLKRVNWKLRTFSSG